MSVAGGSIGEGGSISVSISDAPPWRVEVVDGDLRLAYGNHGLIAKAAVIDRHRPIRFRSEVADLGGPDYEFELASGRRLRWHRTTYGFGGEQHVLPEGKTVVIDQSGAISIVETLWTTWPKR
jgi:hypothetical protein